MSLNPKRLPGTLLYPLLADLIYLARHHDVALPNRLPRPYYLRTFPLWPLHHNQLQTMAPFMRV